MMQPVNVEIQNACQILVTALGSLLSGNPFSLYLYGSAVLDDFRPGWSDIDILCLTEQPLDEQAAQSLVYLRQLLVEKHSNKLFRSFEGAILSRDAFFNNRPDRVVYWGTGGERLMGSYALDPFSLLLLKEQGIAMAGEDIRDSLPTPLRQDLVAAIAQHLDTIRRHAVTTGGGIYSAGWLLDIARCLYTLQTNCVISKTGAAQWAIANALAPNMPLMQAVLTLRQDPSLLGQEPYTTEWLSSLGPDIQRFADVLERELNFAHQLLLIYGDKTTK